VEEGILWIERVPANPGYFVLRGNYGTYVSRKFGISRQGVRWRFWRLFNDMYISAYETILFVEGSFGTNLRQGAMATARERFLRRQQLLDDPLFRAANSYHGKDED